MPDLTYTSGTDLEYAQSIFGTGLTIQTVTTAGAAGQMRMYTDGDTNAPNVTPANSGLILSTGTAENFNDADTTNDLINTNNAGAGDADLDALTPNTTFDAVALEVTFTADGDGNIEIPLTYLTEEYPEFVNQNLSDIAAVFLNGVLLPISDTTSGYLDVDSLQSNPTFLDNGNTGTTNVYGTDFNGIAVGTVKFDVEIGQTYTLKIAIADVGDGSYDSALVIGEGAIQLKDYVVDGTDNDDIIDATYVDADGDIVDGGDGGGPAGNEDTVQAGGGNDSVLAGDGIDTVYGGTGNDTLDGGAGADTIYGDGGNDIVYGGAGDDTIITSNGDSVYGGAGDDLFLVDTSNSDTGTITIFGGETDEGGADTTNDNYTGADNPTGDILDLSDLYANNLIQTGSLTFDPLNSENGSVTLNDGTVINFSEIENFICFTRGSLIQTDSGEKLIEELMIGDLVMTQDHGYQPLRWVGSRTVPAVDKMAPILIKEGTLGATRDLMVSPQHRMLVSGWQAELLFGEREVLVPAKHMINDSTILRREGGEVEYFHLLFDTHEIIFANGSPSESFHPGETGFSVLDQQARDEIYALFPELFTDVESFGKSARRSLKAHEGQILAENPDFLI